MLSLLYGVDPRRPHRFPYSSQILPDEYGRDQGLSEVVYLPLDMNAGVQEAIVAHCEAAHAAAGDDILVDSESGSALSSVPGGYCLLNEIKAWVEAGATPVAQQHGPWPLASEAALLAAVQAFLGEVTPSNPPSHIETLRQLDRFEEQTGFILNDAGDDIVGYYVSFNSSIPIAAVQGQVFGGDVTILEPAFARWERVTQQDHLRPSSRK